jgi:DNA-directed RNA polymerase subunit RPC12/RpoP
MICGSRCLRCSALMLGLSTVWRGLIQLDGRGAGLRAPRCPKQRLAKHRDHPLRRPAPPCDTPRSREGGGSRACH